MGAGASGKYKKSSVAERRSAVTELDDTEKREIISALQGLTNTGTATNKLDIQVNRSQVYELESVVYGNRQKLYSERTYIEENRQLILKNYAASFSGNRFMANQNSEDIFRNRMAILKAVPAVDAVMTNFVESHLSQAQVDVIEHHAKLNGRVAAVNAKMAKINVLLSEVNTDIMEGNQEIVDWNAIHANINSLLLSGEVSIKDEGASSEENAARIANTSNRVRQIIESSNKNSAKYAQVLSMAEEQRLNIMTNGQDIHLRRLDIQKNHEVIASNALKVSAMILKGSIN